MRGPCHLVDDDGGDYNDNNKCTTSTTSDNRQRREDEKANGEEKLRDRKREAHIVRTLIIWMHLPSCTIVFDEMVQMVDGGHGAGRASQKKSRPEGQLQHLFIVHEHAAPSLKLHRQFEEKADEYQRQAWSLQDKA